MEEPLTGEMTQRQPIVCCSHNPCYYLQEAIRAILKCLGLESSTSRDSSSSSSEQNDGEDTEASPQQSRSATQQGTNSSAADPPSTTQQDNNTLEDAEIASVLRRRPLRPPIISESRPGGGSQIN